MKPCLILAAFMLLTFTAAAQKNAPVAGQASILTDLLKKDYSSIDPDLTGDQLVTDRAQVISILKSFLKQIPYTGYAGADALTQATTDAAAKTDAYLNAKRAYSAPSPTSISTGDPNVMKSIQDSANKKLADYNITRKAYYTAKFVSDIAQLDFLQYEFTQDQGDKSFVASVIALFIKKYNSICNSQPDGYATVNPNGGINKALPVIGAFGSTTEIIDGLSKFLAKRIKEELTTFAVQNIQTWLTANSKKTPIEELLVLFPSTAAYLMKFDADKVTSFPAEIKQYIENDLNHLLDNSYQLKNTTLFNGLIKKHPDLLLAFEAFHLVPQLTKLKNPSDFISVLNGSDLIVTLSARKDDASVNIVNSLAFLEMMSNSLTIADNGETQYTTVDFWGTYGREIPFMQLYLGFLSQQNIKYYNVKFISKSKTTNLDALLKTAMSDADALQSKVIALQPILTDICKNAESIYDQAQNLRKLNNAGQKPGADTIFSFNKSVIDFARDLGNDADKIIAVLDTNVKPGIAQKIHLYVMIADTANDALKNIFDKKYASGIIELLEGAYAIIPNGTIGAAITYGKLYNLSTIKSTAWKDWAIISGPASANQKASSNNIASELVKIAAFYTSSTPKTDPKLIALFQQARNLLDNQPSDAASKLDTIMADEGFRTAVVSYYAGFLITAASDDLALAMGQFRDDGKGNISPALNKAAIKSFQANIQKYISLVFTSRIQANTDTLQLISKENEIATIIQSYLNNLPSVFGNQLDSRIVGLIHFINDMALAKNSDDVEQAIEALALPAGSYSIKQKSIYTLTINAFPGIIGGSELTTGHKAAGSIGFTAPLGLNMTWGNVWKSWTLGAFVPVIDIGAVTRYRLDQDASTTALPSLTWANFFSPGLYLTIGIGKTPFSVNLGAQYGPQVTDINTPPGASTWRVGAAITIDIPLLNIYNRPIAK